MWPKAPASHLERPPQFVSVVTIFFYFILFLFPLDKIHFSYLVLFSRLLFGPLCVWCCGYVRHLCSYAYVCRPCYVINHFYG